MKRKQTVEIHSCDNPKCRTEQVDDGINGALGIHGVVTEHTNNGGYGGEFFACSRKCVNAAIVHVVNGDRDKEDM